LFIALDISVAAVVEDCGELEMAESDEDQRDGPGDEQDGPAAVSRHENIKLKQLCSRLRRDLKQVLLFSTADCQVMTASVTAGQKTNRCIDSNPTRNVYITNSAKVHVICHAISTCRTVLASNSQCKHSVPFPA